MADATLASRYRMKNYTDGSLLRNIWDLSWPSVLSAILLTLPSLLEGVWIGKLGAEAIAAVGIGMALRITMISPLMALSSASSAVVARYIGARDQDRANCAALQAVVLFILTAGTIGLLGLTAIEPLLRLAGATGGVLPLSIRYLRIILVGLIAMEMVPSTGFMLTGAGSPQLSLQVNLLVSGITMVLEPVLVLGWGPVLGSGVSGAALSLVVANTFGALYALFLLFTRRAPVWIDTHRLTLDWPMIKRIVRIALPAVIQRGTPNLANSILLRLISIYGTVPLAAYNVVMRVQSFAIIPGMGTSRAAGALVGQNLGARKPERAERGAMYIGSIVSAMAALSIGLVIAFNRPILGLFTQDTEVIAHGARAAYVLGLGSLLYTVSLAFEGALAGAGDTVSPMVINTIFLWAIQLPLVYLLSRGLDWGTMGVWGAIALSRFCLAAMTFFRFKQGHWKRKEL